MKRDGITDTLCNEVCEVGMGKTCDAISCVYAERARRSIMRRFKRAIHAAFSGPAKCMTDLEGRALAEFTRRTK